jgi:site-specific recombinase XerD
VRFCRFERRLAELTSSAYERDVRACLKYLRVQGVESWSDVRPPDLRAFLADEAVRRPAASSQARTVAALKGLFRFCVRRNGSSATQRWCCAHPRSARRCPTSSTATARSGARMSRLSSRVGARASRQTRARPALAALFAYAGLRRSEQRPRRSGGTARSASSLTWCEQAQARHAAHAAPRVRLRAAACRCQPPANQELLGHRHLDSTQRYTRVTAHQLRGAIRRLQW